MAAFACECNAIWNAVNVVQIARWRSGGSRVTKGAFQIQTKHVLPPIGERPKGQMPIGFLELSTNPTRAHPRRMVGRWPFLSYVTDRKTSPMTLSSLLDRIGVMGFGRSSNPIRPIL